MQGSVPHVADQHDHHIPACLLHYCLVSKKLHPCYMAIASRLGGLSMGRTYVDTTCKANSKILGSIGYRIKSHTHTQLDLLVKCLFTPYQQQPARPVVLLILQYYLASEQTNMHGVALHTVPTCSLMDA